ncbi:hypothetical protein [Ferrovibrio sp.]|uniref:hypothetical protein n=1 Tax=Ferrovibrio sp. TaxID=1917215 RepID=UPI003512EA47
MDAVRAYKAGALRPAITAIWVSIVFDLIEKYRELEGLGDAEAKRFLSDWDTASSNQAVDKLLKMERGILLHAREKFELLDSISFRDLDRLRDDRHLCAHPAFSGEAQLFEPPPELVRLHLVNAVNLLLSQRPVQGKTILEEFSKDLLSPGFPALPQHTANYIEQKYLVRMRNSMVKNLALILAKSILKGTPEEWGRVRQKVLRSLDAISQRRAELWPEIQAELLRLIEDGDYQEKINSLPLLVIFPSLASQIREATVITVREALSNDEVVRSLPPSAFAAVSIDAFRDHFAKAFASLDSEGAGLALQESPALEYWPESLSRYRGAKSFRGAERLFEIFIAPFRGVVRRAHMDDLLDVIGSNGQIYDASGTPELLLDWLRVSPFETPSYDAVTRLADALLRVGLYHRYSDIWSYMKEFGWNPPPEAAVESDDFPF